MAPSIITKFDESDDSFIKLNLFLCFSVYLFAFICRLSSSSLTIVKFSDSNPKMLIFKFVQ